MKVNSTQVVDFTLSAYFDTGLLKYLYFMIILLLYVCIISSNLLLIVVICMNSSLHEPMYMFVCSLFVNELYGSAGLFPFLLLQILSDTHTVSASFCFLQLFCLYSFGGVEFSNLAVMSYDRYLAICCPLQYNTRMTPVKVALLIALTWLPSVLLIFVITCLSASLQLCGNIINKVHCDNYYIIKLACSDTSMNNIFELIAAFLLVCIPLSVILFTYTRILKVCFSGSTQTRQKAVSTCSPHLASVLNFFCGSSFQIIQSRFNMSRLPSMFQIFLSLYVLTCPPLFNPLIYGLKMSKICIMCKILIVGKCRASNKSAQLE